MNIKVTVDYGRGYYYVTGLTEGPNGGKFSEIQKIISGIDDDGKTKYNYTDKKLIEERKKELKSTIKKIMKINPKFKISKDALKKVDLLMFITLKRWDEQLNNNSNYATKYLMAVIQEFDKKNSPGISKKVFKKKCLKARADALRTAGIDITYNVGMLGANDNLSFLDKIIGIRIAKIQQKLLGVKVINKPIVQKVNTVYDDRSIYTNLPNNIDIPEDFENRIINKTMEQINLQDEVKYAKEVQSEDNLLEFDGEDDIVNNIALNLEKDRENGIFNRQKSLEDNLLEFDGEDDIVNNIALNLEKDRENGLFNRQKSLEDNLLEFDGEDDIVNNIALNLKKDRENGVFNRQEKNSTQIESIKQLQKEVKEKIEEIDSTEVASLGQIEVNQSAKETTEKARIINEMAQKAKNSLEKMNKELKQLNAKSKEVLINGETEEAYLTSEKIKSSLDRINKQFEEIVRKNNDNLDKIAVQPVKKNVLNTTAEPVIEFTKLKETKNKNKETNETVTEGKTADKIISIERGRARKGIWTRKISNQKNSIQNKKFNQNTGKFKERIVRTAITILAAGSVGLAAYNATKIGNVFGENNDSKVNYEKDVTSDLVDMQNNDTSDLVDMKKTNTPVKTKVQTAKLTVKKQEAKLKENVNTKMKVEKESKVETKTKLEDQKVVQKTEQEKIEEFRELAVQKYIDSFVIGEKPSVVDMFEGETFSERPDGKGASGSFDDYSNYELEHVTIMLPDGTRTESTDGQTLQEILNKYPNYTGYGLHFLNLETGKGLGFVTETQLAEMIDDEIDSIIKNKTATNTKKNNTQDYDER